MQTANNFIVLNIREYLENDDKCPLNLDVERFLKQQSIEFAKKHQAVTYNDMMIGGTDNDKK